MALAAGALAVSVSIARSDVGEQIAMRTADALHALPRTQREHTVVFGESYIVAAYLDGYSTRYGLPPSYSANRSYGYFLPPPGDHDTLLYIGRDPGEQQFDTVQTVRGVGDDMHVYLLTGQQQSGNELWPKMRPLTVS